MFAPRASRTASKQGAVTSGSKWRLVVDQRRAWDVGEVAWRPAGRVQAKLFVGSIDNPLEAEADQIAEQVVHHPTRDGMRAAGLQSSKTLGPAASYDSPSELLSGAGQPLEASLRAFFEPQFGFDFSRVRIFTDERAANSAQSMGALAYTAGPNIAFGHGLYQPRTGEGRRLLAHELAHVVQQGHAAAMDGGGVPIAAGRATPAIQRDTPPGPGPQQTIPPGATNQGGPLSVTKRYDPVNASREEVVKALTEYLNKELALQGTRQLAVTDRVRDAVLKLFQGDPIGYGFFNDRLSKAGLPESPADFAAMVGGQLPDLIPRKQMSHLDAQPAKDADPNSVTGKVKGALKEKVGELGKPPKDVGNPNGPVEAPSNQPTMGSSPGQHTIGTPDIPWGGASRKDPKPNQPQAPLASDDEAVTRIVQALDDDALVPGAAKHTPQAEDFGSARLLAQTIANQLAAGEAKKQYTVEVTIGIGYRHVEGLGEIFDRIENIVRQIAAVLPGGAKDVNEVIISPARAGKSDKYPARRVVKLHSGD